MGVRVGLLFLVVLGISWTCADARTLIISDPSVMQISYEKPKSKIQATTIAATDERVCLLCEQFTAQAVEYLSDNKTQKQVIEGLHLACHKLHSLKQKCIMLVDYYAPLFFLELGTIQPEHFCMKMDLCDQGLIASLEQKPDGCTLCHRTVEEIQIKLKDPDTQLDIIEMLLKACDAVENHVKECKKMVFEYGPLFMDNAEQFLEMTDVCAVLHACKTSVTGVEASSHVEISILSES
ncbi:prosaposin-like [Macadamia integrifolia]|uniref:prosaposin-like n=1 Tax=Macadamia integrifolia TaxID=60698 RepID=UPI001C500D25|nr:prosaposin-like [Macadamia integrifolia]XP_042503910.1 prosaposin-like [Macadamia integrifolia]XP_042503911.1 prosaposin-like [Macadamia integrifolia]